MIDKRLKQANTYAPLEIYRVIPCRPSSCEYKGTDINFQTLVLMQQCLPIASQPFVDYYINKIQRLALTYYMRSDTRSDREMSELVSDRARSLSKLFLNPPR